MAMKENGKIDKEEQKKLEVIEFATKICEHYSSGNYTIASCCGKEGISVRAFNQYCNKYAECADLYKKAKRDAIGAYKAELVEKAQTALEKAIEGYFIEETETVERFNKIGDSVGRSESKRRSFVKPNVTAIIFALKNCDPMSWNNEGLHEAVADEQVFKIGDQVIKFT
jgi:HEPN domain-containing protein